MELANDDKALKKVFRIKINIGRLLSLISLKQCLIITQKCYGMCKNNKSKYVTIPAGRKHFLESYTNEMAWKIPLKYRSKDIIGKLPKIITIISQSFMVIIWKSLLRKIEKHIFE